MNPFSGRDRRRVGYSVVDAHLVVRGDIETDGTVRVDGRVEGSAHHADTLIVGPGGVMLGDVEAREVAVAGAIHGNVRATGRIEIQPGASIEGDVVAATVVLHEGGSVNGQVSIGSADGSAATIGASPRLELARSDAAVEGVQ